MMRLCWRIALPLLLLCSTLAHSQSVTLPPAERVVLGNGAVLVLVEKKDVPLVGLRAVVRGGAVVDPAGKEGVSALFAAMLEKGAGDRSAAEFAEAVDSVGGRLSASAGLEGVSISGDFMARDAELLVSLLADMLLRPTLDRAEFAKLRDRSVNLLLAAKDSDPGQLMPTYASAFLFADHPYGNAINGSESSLAAISHRDLRNYYSQQVGGDRLIISMSGDFDAAAMRALLTEAFGEWRPASEALPQLAAPEYETGRRVLLIDKPGATQSYFWIGNVGVARSYSKRADLDLANTLFGGRFTSMLNTALRVESGLTYGARSRLSQPTQPGSVAISSFTETGTTVEAIDMALGILGQLHDTGLSEEMIGSARNYVLGQYPTRLETAAQLAVQYAILEVYDLGTDYVNAYGEALAGVTTDSIATVVREVYPARDDLVFVVLGDAEQIRDGIANYGPVTEMSITEPRFRVPDTPE